MRRSRSNDFFVGLSKPYASSRHQQHHHSTTSNTSHSIWPTVCLFTPARHQQHRRRPLLGASILVLVRPVRCPRHPTMPYPIRRRRATLHGHNAPHSRIATLLHDPPVFAVSSFVNSSSHPRCRTRRMNEGRTQCLPIPPSSTKLEFIVPPRTFGVPPLLLSSRPLHF